MNITDDAVAWWLLLCAISLVNVCAWLFTVQRLRRRHASVAPATRAALRLQMLLSAGYVLGCAFRSAFPVFDVQRLCFVDSWLSSVLVGRSVATVAELCFAAQWAMLLRGVARSTRSRLAHAVSHAVLPMIVVAEICSWSAVLTTANVGHVVEESLWGACAALLVLSLAIVWPRCRRELRPMLATGCTLGLAYVGFMFMVDVPMYWARWLVDLSTIEQGGRFLSISQGVADAAGRWVVSHRWQDWQSEMVWMTLYFSVAVWLSIALMHLPALQWSVENREGGTCRA